MISTEEEYDKIKKGFKYSFICKKCGKQVFNSVKKSKKWREKQLLFLCRSCAIRFAVKKKYGVDNVFQMKEVKEKSKQTCLDKYGAKSFKESKNGKEQFINFSLNKYGVENPFQAEEIKEKSKQTCLNKYGSEYAASSEIVKEKIKQTCLDRYGVEHALQADIFKEKFKQTCLDKYGTENPNCLQAVRNKTRNTNIKKYGSPCPLSNRFIFDGFKFDSSWELCLYIYCKDKGIQISRNTNTLYYKCKEKTFAYQPDFLIEGKLVEVKGDYFFENDKLINPYNRNLDYIAEAKQKCMEENNVIVLKWQNIKKYIDYVNLTYGKKYIEEKKWKTIEI